MDVADLSKELEASLEFVKPTSTPTSFSILPIKRVTGPLSTQKRDNHCIILELSHYSLVNCLYVTNKSASYCTVKIAETNKTADYTVVAENCLLPHNKVSRVPLGTLPCKFVKIMFEKGAPISVKKLELYGCRIEQTETCMGLGYASAILQNPHGIVY